MGRRSGHFDVRALTGLNERKRVLGPSCNGHPNGSVLLLRGQDVDRGRSARVL
jgi:hypothetical protein